MKTEINTSETEERLLYFLQTEIHKCSLKKTFFLSENSINNIVLSEKKHIIEEINIDKTKTLIKLIEDNDNQIIINNILKFLDESKTSNVHILKIPKALKESKYKIFFWMLFFCHKNQENFQSGFQKLITEISKEYPKKTVFDMLNLGVTLVKIKTDKQELFTSPISVIDRDKKRLQPILTTINQYL